MDIQLDTEGGIPGFARVVLALAQSPSVKAILVLAGDGNGHTPENTDPILKQAGIPVYGAVFPQIIQGRQRLERGTLAIGLTVVPETLFIPGLSTPGLDLDAAVEPFCAGARADATVVTLVDGFSTRIAALLKALFEGQSVPSNFIGGGAGSLSFQQKPCLFTPSGLVQDAALLLALPFPGGVGVAHGWRVISDPIQVTRASGNTIHELNHRPAIEVYREVVAPHAGQAVQQSDFFKVAKAYPFGIRKLDAEVVVRDPIALSDDGSLVCVGEVPPRSLVHILHGDSASLVSAAARASCMALERINAKGRVPDFGLFIDCISRVLFLQDQFDQELVAVEQPGLLLVGALTLGEIANSGDDYLEFYNKTAVVGLLSTCVQPGGAG